MARFILIAGGVLLADTGFPNRPYMVTPFLNARTQAQARYNRAHKHTRVRIEQINGVLKNTFRLAHYSQISPVCTRTFLKFFYSSHFPFLNLFFIYFNRCLLYGLRMRLPISALNVIKTTLTFHNIRIDNGEEMPEVEVAIEQPEIDGGDLANVLDRRNELTDMFE